MLFHFLLISSISTNYLLFKYKIFNVANEWSNEQIKTFNDKTRKTYETNMKACQLMFAEDKCELINGYLNSTVFLKISKYGDNYYSYLSDDTDFIFFNIYSSTASTPLRFDFENKNINVYVKSASMSSLLLEEDKFSFIQENSQKMYQKVMKNYYHLDIPVNDYGVHNKRIIPKEIKQVTIKGYDPSSVPFLYFESCALTFSYPYSINSLMLVGSTLFYDSNEISVDYFYSPLITYSSGPNKIKIKKQATAVMTDQIKTNASSSFYDIHYYKDGIIISYAENPDESGSSFGTMLPFSIAQQFGFIARGLHFNFTCYQNNENCAKFKTNLTIVDEFPIPTVNLLEEKEKIKINILSSNFIDNNFIINYDKNKYEIERVDALNTTITEEESYVYKPKSDKPNNDDIDSLSFTENESLNEPNDEPKDNPPKKDSNIGWIVGIAVCAVVIVALVIIIVILVIRNRKSNHKSASAKEGEL